MKQLHPTNQLPSPSTPFVGGSKNRLPWHSLFLLAVAFLLSPIVWTPGLPSDERLNAYFPETCNLVRSFWQGHIPHWNPYSFGGAPGLATHQFGFFHLPNLILFGIFDPAVAGKLGTWLHFWLAGLLMAGYLRSERLHQIAALTGAITWMASGHLMAKVGHVSHFHGAALAPGLFWAASAMAQRPSTKSRLLPMAAFAVLFALIIFAGYMQVAVFAALAVAIVYTPCILRRKSWPVIVLIITGFLIGSALAAIQVLPTLHYVGLTERTALTYEEFSKYYFPTNQWPMLLLPLIYGADWASPHPYSGLFNPAEITGWIGLIPLYLAVIGILALRRRRSRLVIIGWILLAIASFLFCLGPQTPVYRLMFEVPVYNLFRGAARNFFGVHLAISVLAGFGIHTLLLWLRTTKTRTQGRIALAIAPLISITLIGLLAVAAANAFWGIAIPANTNSSTYWVPIIAQGITAASVVLFFLFREPRLLLGLILPFAMESAWTQKQLDPPYVSGAELPFDQKLANLLPPEIADSINPNDWRVYPVRFEHWHGGFQSFAPSLHLYGPLRSLSGYGPLFPKGLTDLFGIGSTGVVNNQLHMLEEARVFSLFNIRYVALRDYPETPNYQVALEKLKNSQITWPTGQPTSAWREVAHRPDGTRIFENPHALPRAWSIRQLFTATDHTMDEKTQYTRSLGFLYNTSHPWNPANEALYTGTIPASLEVEFTARVLTLEHIGPNEVSVQLDGNGPGFVVLSENHLPGWSARIDGQQEVPIHAINGLHMGVATPPGTTRLDFRYTAPGFFNGAMISGIALLLVIIWLCWCRYSRQADHACGAIRD